jgi:hypothetical protein
VVEAMLNNFLLAYHGVDYPVIGTNSNVLWVSTILHQEHITRLGQVTRNPDQLSVKFFLKSPCFRDPLVPEIIVARKPQIVRYADNKADAIQTPFAAALVPPANANELSGVVDDVLACGHVWPPN